MTNDEVNRYLYTEIIGKCLDYQPVAADIKRAVVARVHPGNCKCTNCGENRPAHDQFPDYCSDESPRWLLNVVVAKVIEKTGPHQFASRLREIVNPGGTTLRIGDCIASDAETEIPQRMVEGWSVKVTIQEDGIITADSLKALRAAYLAAVSERDALLNTVETLRPKPYAPHGDSDPDGICKCGHFRSQRCRFDI